MQTYETGVSPIGIGLRTPRKNYPVLVDRVILEDGSKMSLDGLKFFELTRSLKIKDIRDVKKNGFARVKVIFGSAENTKSFVSSQSAPS